MKKVAITGGIGSGKSKVLSIIQNADYPVFSCDEIYKKVIVDEKYIKKIAEIFPTAVIDGKIDRKILGEMVFSDDENRKKLDAIAHPLIMQRLVEEMSLVKSNIAFAEVPLLFEGGFQSFFDGIIVVKRDKQLRIDGIEIRDNLDKKSIEDRISAQFDYDCADNQAILEKNNVKFILNNGSVDELKEQVNLIIQAFI